MCVFTHLALPRRHEHGAELVEVLASGGGQPPGHAARRRTQAAQLARRLGDATTPAALSGAVRTHTAGRWGHTTHLGDAEAEVAPPVRRRRRRRHAALLLPLLVRGTVQTPAWLKTELGGMVQTQPC